MKTSVTKTVFACVLGFLAYLALLGPAAMFQVLNKTADFPHFRIGAELVGTGELYNAAAVSFRQAQVFGTTYPVLVPVRVPAYYLFLKPLVLFSAKVGENVWLSAIVAAMCLVVAVQPEGYRANTAIAFFWCGATLFSVLYSQDAVFSALGLVGFQRLRESNRPGWAGFVLAAAMLPKPHILILMPLMLLMTKDWSLLRGWAIGLAGFGLLSFWAEGNWMMPWIRMATSSDANSPHVVMPNLHGLLNWAGVSPLWEIPGSLIVVVLALIAARGPSQLALLSTLTAGLLVSRHAFPADCLVLLPFLITGGAEIVSITGRFLTVWLLSPIPYLMALFSKGGYLLPISLCALLLVIWCSRPTFGGFAPANGRTG